MVNIERLFVMNSEKGVPAPPPLPLPAERKFHLNGLLVTGSSSGEYGRAAIEKTELWDRLFDEGYKADVCISTDNDGIVYAHSCILGMSSPVLRSMLKNAKRCGQKHLISIRGVPADAVRVFVRFLYSFCYEKKEMESYALHLLVLSHVYMIPQLKQVCIQKLEAGFLTTENVIDLFQLSLLCDAPRLSLVCHRTILKNLTAVSDTEGWKVMKKTHPMLEKEIIGSVVAEENMKKERIRKHKEREIYLQLYEAMEALVHICRDGCQTIGPNDKDLGVNKEPCHYEACKGLERLIRHFAGCKLRVPGGCVHCKRMWQLLELHSRLCADSDYCRVPLCRNFKDRIQKQSKKDEFRWRRLVEKILRTKGFEVAPFFSWSNCQ